MMLKLLPHVVAAARDGWFTCCGTDNCRRLVFMPNITYENIGMHVFLRRSLVRPPATTSQVKNQKMSTNNFESVTDQYSV